MEQKLRKVLGQERYFTPKSFFIEDPGNPKHHKNVKSNSNSTGSHLVSCNVISRSAIMKEGEKEVFSWRSRI